MINLSEIKPTFEGIGKKEDFFLRQIDVLKLSKLHNYFASVKQKGHPIVLLFSILVAMPFIKENSVNSFASGYWNKVLKIGKDAFYRLINNATINWRGFLMGTAKLVAKALVARDKAQVSNQTRPTAFVIDDTTIIKTGKAIEGVSMVFNHVVNRFVLGYQLLVIGYYNGSVFMPVDFSYHRESGKNKKRKYGLSRRASKKQYRKHRAPQQPGYQRKRELSYSKIRSAVAMLSRVVGSGLRAQYTIVDSWFTCWELFIKTRSLGMHFLGMFSKYKTLFVYNGKKLTYNDLRTQNNKKLKRNRTYKLQYKMHVVEWGGHKIQLYNIRAGKKGKWKTIINSNLALNFTQMIEIYQIRWTIEVFFKESKGLFALGRYQGRNFDAQIATTTISLIEYLLMALQRSVDSYESIGNLFAQTSNAYLEVLLHDRLLGLLKAVLVAVEKIFGDADMDDVMRKLVSDEQVLNQFRGLWEYDNRAA